MLARFLSNHVLANLTFMLVLIVGFLSYAYLLPREKDPEINFNWVNIITSFPGATAEDVEQRITDVLEDGVEKIQDTRFVSSYSREGLSNILVRFDSISERLFDRRMNELRTEIQNQARLLPDDVEDPHILEITTSNAFPTVTVVVVGKDDNEQLRQQARLIEKDLERILGVDRVDSTGLRDPQLQIDYDAQTLADAGITPVVLANSVSAWFRDLAAGRLRLGDQNWSVRIKGTDADPQALAQLPLLTSVGLIPTLSGNAELRLDDIAEVKRGREQARQSVRYQGQPAVLLAIFKSSSINTLELLDRIKQNIEKHNQTQAETGIKIVLVDDRTVSTRNAIATMQRNALVGLVLVLIVTWLFLGSRIALLTTIGIPFTLAGTFWALATMGGSLNTSVLLGVVIALGMLVDDAVVVVEGMYYRISRRMSALDAARESLREVFAPVTTSVLTTMAAFLPLMLMPGILGEFMKVIPLVVTIALAISLIEAYWMLPAHIIALNIRPSRSRMQDWRERMTHQLRLRYARSLIRALHRPLITLTIAILLIIAAAATLISGKVRIDFFAMETFRLFYVNIEMPPGSHLQHTLNTTEQIEARLRSRLQPDDARAIVSYAGQMFTETEPLFGDRYGQILVSLNPKTDALREVDEVIDAVREILNDTPGPLRVTLFPLKEGPPTGKPISVKVRGDDWQRIRSATDAIQTLLANMPEVSDISDDADAGPPTLTLKLNTDAVRQSGLTPQEVMRSIRLNTDGEIVASLQHQGEEIDVRVRRKPQAAIDTGALLHLPIALRILPQGAADAGTPSTAPRQTALSELLEISNQRGLGSIRHYNFRRAITVQADLDTEKLNVQQANLAIQQNWQKIAHRYPDIQLDFTGQFDDINESLDAIVVLFILGIGLIYLILGSQFRSYFQPMMILFTVPMAFTGVVAGLYITGHPLSLFTLYGVVALAGISVNAAIVLISASNQRLNSGMSIQHAAIYAARRRVVPVLITALTTIAGLFSLAIGLGGKSLLWGPVATAIVWGLTVSTVLTLFVIPILYVLFMRLGERMKQ